MFPSMPDSRRKTQKSVPHNLKRQIHFEEINKSENPVSQRQFLHMPQFQRSTKNKSCCARLIPSDKEISFLPPGSSYPNEIRYADSSKENPSRRQEYGVSSQGTTLRPMEENQICILTKEFRCTFAPASLPAMRNQSKVLKSLQKNIFLSKDFCTRQDLGNGGRGTEKTFQRPPIHETLLSKIDNHLQKTALQS